jgi:hypothetical protein
MASGSRYLIGGKVVDAVDPNFQQLLAASHDDPIRPRCLCVPGGVEMYIAKYEQYFLKRMPETGHEHHPCCDAFEPRPCESGLDYLLDGAVVQKAPDLLEVRTVFPLDRFDGRIVDSAESQETAGRSSPHRKLTLKGLLHLLWERAGFNRWSPAMQGKRSQGVIRKYIVEAAERIELKGLRLSQRLYVPEPFKPQDTEELNARREKAFSVMTPQANSAKHSLMLVIGEIKELFTMASEHSLAIKHLPGCHFLLDRKLATQLLRNYAREFKSKELHPDMRLLAAFTILNRNAARYYIDAITVMMTNANWIPVENVYEKAVADALTQAGRRFLKPLRYDAPHSVVVPNLLLLDAGNRPIRMNVAVATTGRRRRDAKVRLGATREPRDWVWKTDASSEMPPLPPLQAQPASHGLLPTPNLCRHRF